MIVRFLSLVAGLLLVLVLTNSWTWSQQTYSRFSARYDGGDVEYGFGVCESPEGNFTVAGFMGFGPGGSDACIMQLDPGGTQLWTMAYGGSGYEEARAIAVTRDSGYIFVGQTSSFGAGSSDVLVAKLDATGQVDWARAIGGTGSDVGVAVDTTTDGGYIVGGYTRSFGAGSNDGYFIKLSAVGAVEWTRTVGGLQAELIYDVVQTPGGGYSGAGYTTSFGGPATEYYLVQLSSTGTLINTVTYGGNSSDNGFGLIATTDGGLMLYGYSSGFGTGGNEGMLIKTDASGGVTWARTYGSPAMDRIFHVAETPDGQYVATGETTTNTFGAGDQQVIQVNSTGDIVWARHYGTSVDETGFGASVPTSDGGLILAAWDDNDEDILLNKMDSLGENGCNNAVTSLTITTPALVINSGGTAGSGGTVTNVSLPATPNALTQVPYCSNVLPVGEVTLRAENLGRHNHISWELAEPHLVLRLVLERSGDGVAYTVLHRASDIVATGHYRDPAGQGEVVYYRLALTDQNGQQYFSKVRRVVTEGLLRRVGWTFAGEHPGAREIAGLAVDAAMAWEMRDVTGKLLAQGAVAAGETAVLDLPTVARGMYLLRLQQAGRVTVVRVLR